MKKRLFFRTFLLITILFLTFLTERESYAQEISLSDIQFGFIANEFGPPNKNLSWNKQPLRIGDKLYEKGLGVHAPSHICIDLKGSASMFVSDIGMNKEATDRRDDAEENSVLTGGPQVLFEVLGDKHILYSSGWMSGNSPPVTIKVPLEGVNQLCLTVRHSPSGPEDTFADWADARIILKETGRPDQFILRSHPAGILINHTGFIPASDKLFRIAGLDEPESFHVIDQNTGTEVLSGSTETLDGDWGPLQVGDFSALKKPGNYYIQCGKFKSIPFSIHPLNYMDNLKTHLNWFLWQRCGDPYNGWERGQHQDDGRRLDNHRHQDVSGGWHDAADLRKWGMTINGLWALSEIYLSLNQNDLREFEGKRDIILQIKDELAWGNKYFQAMQEPAGYLMNQVGGDVYEHGDNNRFTDNIIGTPDDRWIVTTPNAPVFQLMFVISQCNISIAEGRISENPYIEKAIRCFQWVTESDLVSNIHELGAVLTASLKLYQATGEKKYHDMASRYLEKLLSRQNSSHRPFYGFMAEYDPTRPDAPRHYPDQPLSYQLITPNFPVWSIVESMHLIENPGLVKKAQTAFNLWVDHFIRFFDSRSSYGIVPIALYDQDPGGGRKAGDYFYRWCYVNRENDDWWNGINPRIGYAGACLIRGGLITGNKKALRIGQQQLDFIYGCNPFNASTVTRLGFNQPEFFKTSEFVPHTPLINGAVMAGIGSSEEDLPVLLPSWWQTTEYWMEAVSGTIMLLNELNNRELKK